MYSNSSQLESALVRPGCVEVLGFKIELGVIS